MFLFIGKNIFHTAGQTAETAAMAAILLSQSTREDTLMNYRYRHKFVADNGENGKNSKMPRQNGSRICILPVPPGTVMQ